MAAGRDEPAWVCLEHDGAFDACRRCTQQRTLTMLVARGASLSDISLAMLMFEMSDADKAEFSRLIDDGSFVILGALLVGTVIVGAFAPGMGVVVGLTGCLIRLVALHLTRILAL